MNFLILNDALAPLICSNINQVKSYFPNIDKTNLTRWVNQNQLIRLRQGWYSFPEYQKDIDFRRLAANKIYMPSYISLQYAMSFYEMIPETVIQITSVSSLKTAHFENKWGLFHYQKVKPSLMFGYEPIIIKTSLANDQVYFMATPEKALLDFLYLNPYYKTKEDFEGLRLDEDFINEELDRERLNDFTQKMQSKSLEKRVKILLDAYD